MASAFAVPTTPFMFNIVGKFVDGLDDDFYDVFRGMKPPWGPVGYITYKRTYARRLEKNNKNSPKEEWWQTVKRCVNGVLSLGGAFTREEAQTLAYYVFDLKCLFSGRGLWQLGALPEEIVADSLQACWQIAINEPIHPFCFTMEQLMLGGGVGFNIMPQNVYSLPIVKHNIVVERVATHDCDYIVPDNRQGWIGLLKRILDGFYYTGKSLRYNTTCIRPKGSPIATFGGVASGPEDLVEGMGYIVEILRRAVGRKLEPIECLDIENIIAMIIVSGNVRRSAEIGCGSGRDLQFLMAKNWEHQTIPRWRQQSNNTVVTSRLGEVLPEFWLGYEGHGEALGLFNPYVAQNYGRLVDGFRENCDPDLSGPNPCGEIPLKSDESCNLGELILVNLANETEFRTAAHLMYKCLKTISCLPFIYDRTNKVVAENHRLGLSVTGFTAAHHLRQPEIFDRVYKSVKDLDGRYSKTLGVKESIKNTTVKPSGTASKLPIGCPPGGNGAYARHLLLGITFSTDDPLVAVCRDNGYMMEPKLNIDGSRDYGSMYVQFPVAYPEGTRTDGDMSIHEQMDNQEFLQMYWADNAVSFTGQYNIDELPSMRKRLEETYDENIKSISFCMHKHGFVQAPNEEISESEYQAYLSKVKPITYVKDAFGIDFEINSQECGSGGCPVR